MPGSWSPCTCGEKTGELQWRVAPRGPFSSCDPPAVSGAVQAAVVTAHLGASTAYRTGPAGAAAGRLVQHGQVGGGCVGGGPLGGCAPRLPHYGSVGVSVEQLGKIWLLEHLSAVIDHPTTAGGRGGRGRGEFWEGETEEGGEGQGEGGGEMGVVEEDGGVGGAGSGRGG